MIFFLYQYTFELANQAFGVEEDRINKPNRPVPASYGRSIEKKACSILHNIPLSFLDDKHFLVFFDVAVHDVVLSLS